MKRLLTVTALLEAATGVGLMVLPVPLVRLLSGATLDSPVAFVLARVAAAALLALGLACWMARDEGGSRAGRGIVAAMTLYNVAVAGALAYANLGLGLFSVGLWPVVVLHVAMAAWCGVGLRGAPQA